MNILITGGRSDIAQAIVEELANQGHSFVLTSRNPETTLPATSEVKWIPFELGNPTDDKSFEEADVLILNAASPLPALVPFHDWDHRELSQYVTREIEGNTWILQKCLQGMQQRSFGRVVFISSISSQLGTADYSPYVMVKAAMESLMRCIAVENGKRNILANSLRLGAFQTSRTESYWSKPAYQKRLLKKVPHQQMGLPVHAAKALLPLIQQEQYINGAAIDLTGGFPMQPKIELLS